MMFYFIYIVRVNLCSPILPSLLKIFETCVCMCESVQVSAASKKVRRGHWILLEQELRHLGAVCCGC